MTNNYEAKKSLMTKMVNNICDKFIDNKSKYNKRECIRLSNKMKNLSKFSVFDECNFYYKDMFIEEIKAFRITQTFIDDLGYDEEDDLFSNLESLNIIYA